MEDMAEALKIAGAILIFIIAITVAFSVLSQAKQTSDVVLESTDKTTLYSYIEGEEDTAKSERTVRVETVISTLYRYYNESFGVKIMDNSRKFNKRI